MFIPSPGQVPPAFSLLQDETFSSSHQRALPVRTRTWRPQMDPSIPWGLQTHAVEIRSSLQVDFLAPPPTGRCMLCSPVGLILPGLSATKCIFIPGTQWKRRLNPSSIVQRNPTEHPQQDPTEQSSKVPSKDFFFIEPVSQQLSVKQPPGQLLLQGSTSLSPFLPWISMPSHPSHLICTIPMKILSPLSQFPHGSVLAAPSQFLPA